MKYFLIPAITLCSFTIATAAEDDIAERMRACAMLADDAQRLACYDDMAGAMTQTAAEAVTAVAPQPASEPQAAATVAARTAVASGAAPAAKPAEAAVTSPSATAAQAAQTTAQKAEDEFGMNRDLEKSRPDDKNKKTELKELKALVTEVRKRPGGEHIVTLENGQKWVEKRAVFGFRVKVGDTVLLKKGTFGGYSMVGRGRRSSQVRRVE